VRSATRVPDDLRSSSKLVAAEQCIWGPCTESVAVMRSSHPRVRTLATQADGWPGKVPAGVVRAFVSLVLYSRLSESAVSRERSAGTGAAGLAHAGTTLKNRETARSSGNVPEVLRHWSSGPLRIPRHMCNGHRRSARASSTLEIRRPWARASLSA
jgi:hypothetical protein